MIKKIALIGIIILFTLLLIYCTTDESTIIGPFGNADKYISVVIYPPDKDLLYSNGDSTLISIKVLDVDKTPAIGLIVNFSAQFGSITESDTTDSSGVATAIFVSDENTGTNIITADTGIKKHTLTLRVVHYQPKYVELFSENPVLLADGIDKTKINVVLKDSIGYPMPGVTVRFNTTLGTLTSKIGVTDDNGKITTELISGFEDGTALVTATSYVTSFVEVEMRRYVPSVIELSSDTPTILADDISSARITAIPKDDQGNIMPGLAVKFSTTLGKLSSVLQSTNSEGIAETILTGGTVEGTAYVTATAYLTNIVRVDVVSAMPTKIVLESSENSILADGMSTVDVTAIAYNASNDIVPGALLDFTSTFGSISKASVLTDQDGTAVITLTSAGSVNDTTATVKAVVTADTGTSENINIQLRGITSITHIDSAKMSDDGIYKAYIRTNLLETILGNNISIGTVSFSSTVGTMESSLDAIDEQGTAFSVFKADVLPTDQNNIIITSELSSSSAVFSKSEEFDIPGAEILINTIDYEVMGDGERWVLVKATLREITGKAITETGIAWETTLGTIIGQSKTNTSGHTIDSLRIEKAVGVDTDVTITAKFGDHISASNILTFIRPVNNNRLIMGFEPDTTAKDPVPCDIENEFATRDAGISVLYVNANSNPIGGQTIVFSIVPNYFAAICPTTVTVDSLNGRALVMLAYPPKHIGEIVRVWAKAPDGTRGSIDVILPIVGGE